MHTANKRILFLTGAPSSSSLTWTEADLCDTLMPCFTGEFKSNSNKELTRSDLAPVWRYLPFEQSHLPTGLTQASREDAIFGDITHDADETSFLTSTNLSFESTATDGDQAGNSQTAIQDQAEVISQYYEHSFAVHEDVLSSQIIGPEPDDDVSYSTDPEDSFLSFTAEENLEERQLIRSRLASGTLSDLKEVPNAGYLRAIIPQTMSVNLVVGIISVSQPRKIQTRRSGRTVELVELLVGDDTKAGFGVNIWLPSEAPGHDMADEGGLRQRTLQLRAQDVVLFKNVALSAFRGKVYGQSLRRGMTTLDLLYRNALDDNDKHGVWTRDWELEAMSDAKIFKVQKVKTWVMEFVGAGRVPAIAKHRVAAPRKLEALPADTP